MRTRASGHTKIVRQSPLRIKGKTGKLASTWRSCETSVCVDYWLECGESGCIVPDPSDVVKLIRVDADEDQHWVDDDEPQERLCAQPPECEAYLHSPSTTTCQSKQPPVNQKSHLSVKSTTCQSNQPPVSQQPPVNQINHLSVKTTTCQSTTMWPTSVNNYLSVSAQSITRQSATTCQSKQPPVDWTRFKVFTGTLMDLKTLTVAHYFRLMQKARVHLACHSYRRHSGLQPQRLRATIQLFIDIGTLCH